MNTELKEQVLDIRKLFDPIDTPEHDEKGTKHPTYLLIRDSRYVEYDEEFSDWKCEQHRRGYRQPPKAISPDDDEFVDGSPEPRAHGYNDIERARYKPTHRIETVDEYILRGGLITLLESSGFPCGYDPATGRWDAHLVRTEPPDTRRAKYKGAIQKTWHHQYPSQEEALIEKEKREQLDQKLQNASGRREHVYRLKEVGYTLNEIAELLKISVNSVKTYLYQRKIS